MPIYIFPAAKCKAAFDNCGFVLDFFLKLSFAIFGK